MVCQQRGLALIVRFMKLYVGASGFAYKEWKGTFYPKDLPNAKMLSYYGQHFNSVEINNTFRRIPEKSVFEGWTGQVPKDFCFAIKAPQRITHIKRLRECGDAVSELFQATRWLKKRAGPVLFQLPPNFKKDLERLDGFLRILPRKHPVTFEFRHPSWFDADVYAWLKRRNAALCVAESEDLAVPREATADWGYLRLRKAEYTRAELKSWAQWILEQDWREAFVFFKHEDTGTTPKFGKMFLELAGRL